MMIDKIRANMETSDEHKIELDATDPSYEDETTKEDPALRQKREQEI
jgi:hypothetical protein